MTPPPEPGVKETQVKEYDLGCGTVLVVLILAITMYNLVWLWLKCPAP